MGKAVGRGQAPPDRRAGKPFPLPTPGDPGHLGSDTVGLNLQQRGRGAKPLKVQLCVAPGPPAVPPPRTGQVAGSGWLPRAAGSCPALRATRCLNDRRGRSAARPAGC